MSGCKNLFRIWRNDRRGAVAIPFGLMLVLFGGFVGAAVDYSRWHNATSRTKDALDAALLAAGRQLQTDPANTDAAMTAAKVHFDQTSSKGIALTDATATFQMTDNGSAIQGDATGTIATPFMSLLNIKTLPVKANAKATLAVGGGADTHLEVALMLDVTGSMCADGNGPCASSPKLDALKQAASDLINIVVRDNSTNVRVSIVPFATRVRLGNTANPQAALMKKVTNLDGVWSGWYEECTSSTGTGGGETVGDWQCLKYDTNYKTSWNIMPCVSDRTGPEAYTDAPPGPNAWVTAHDGARFPKSWDSSDTPIMPGDHLGLTQDDPAWHWDYTPGSYCADIGEGSVLTPLTTDKAGLLAKIQALEAQGATAGALGTAWAWYTLSPDWSGVWPAESAPGQYSELASLKANGIARLRKVAVLMSDGVYNTIRTNIEINKTDPNLATDAAKALCTNMKAKGIEIYTIGFSLDELPAADRAAATDVLKSCGTDVAHFYDSMDAEKLRADFRDIALKLATLYISK